METGFYDGYDAVALRLPNRPAVDLRPLTVRDAARAFRQLDAGNWQAAYRVVLRAALPRRWWARRRARFLWRVRGAELQRVLLRLLCPETVPTPTATGPSKAPDTPRSLDDLLADYASRYGGPPPPTLPWPLVLALVQRAGRYDARDLFHAMTGARMGGAVSSPEVTRSLEQIQRAAYG